LAVRRAAESVGQILETLSRNRRWGRRVFEGKALLVWEDVVGESLREHTRPVRVDGGRLVVAVEDSVWKQEISLLQGEIIEKLNDRIGSEVIRDIVLVVR
jgi:predicted nucleic acid-binding Zn ribbon protein